MEKELERELENERKLAAQKRDQRKKQMDELWKWQQRAKLEDQKRSLHHMMHGASSSSGNKSVPISQGSAQGEGAWSQGSDVTVTTHTPYTVSIHLCSVDELSTVTATQLVVSVSHCEAKEYVHTACSCRSPQTITASPLHTVSKLLLLPLPQIPYEEATLPPPTITHERPVMTKPHPTSHKPRPTSHSHSPTSLPPLCN